MNWYSESHVRILHGRSFHNGCLYCVTRVSCEERLTEWHEVIVVDSLCPHMPHLPSLLPNTFQHDGQSSLTSLLQETNDPCRTKGKHQVYKCILITFWNFYINWKHFALLILVSKNHSANNVFNHLKPFVKTWGKMMLIWPIIFFVSSKIF